MFTLHEVLAADTVLLTDWPLCRVLLMDDATYPWMILVPRRTGLRDLHDLAAEDCAVAMEEIGEASRRLQALYGAEKMNIAALGNVVPQLHIHIIARFSTDAAWPRPVWGVAPRQRYANAERDALAEKLRTTLGKRP